ncbi:MAG: hypothetical protein B6A08_06190 [Sorangiineae bacterium NIC37A_2]|nr:MAG: hypothetical protein B6A08_06190 [Sorangiineae bacterium NIC37A_2]
MGRAAHSALIERARRTDLLALNATVRAGQKDADPDALFAVLAELQGETRALLSALEALPAESKGELESVA